MVALPAMIRFSLFDRSSFYLENKYFFGWSQENSYYFMNIALTLLEDFIQVLY
jgi:hypothetical protein